MYLHVSERWIESIFQYTIRLSLSCWSLKTGLSWCWTQYLASLSTECSPYRQDQTQTSQFGQACPGLAHRDRLDKIGASLSRQIGLVQSLSVRIRQDQSWNLPPMQTAHLIEPATLLVGWCPTIRLLADPAGSLAGLKMGESSSYQSRDPLYEFTLQFSNLIQDPVFFEQHSHPTNSSHHWHHRYST